MRGREAATQKKHSHGRHHDDNNTSEEIDAGDDGQNNEPKPEESVNFFIDDIQGENAKCVMSLNCTCISQGEEEKYDYCTVITQPDSNCEIAMETQDGKTSSLDTTTKLSLTGRTVFVENAFRQSGKHPRHRIDTRFRILVQKFNDFNAVT